MNIEGEIMKLLYKKFAVVAIIVLCLFVSLGYSLTITHGPYLINQNESSVTVVWFTDENAISSVEYGVEGNFNNTVESSSAGIMNVGKHHSVTIKNLESGKKYSYRVSSTKVISYKAYYGELGETIKGENSTFTTFSTNNNSTTFYFMADTKNSGSDLSMLLNNIDVNTTDFIVLGGNCLENIGSESEIFSSVIDPITNKLLSKIPIVYLRGDLEMNGKFAQNLIDYFPTGGRKFYTAFSMGNAMFYAFDAGKDSSDNTGSYGGLIRSENYKKSQINWFKNYSKINSSIVNSANFKIALSNQNNFGYGDNSDWVDYLNREETKLLICGYNPSYVHEGPSNGNTYHTIIVGNNNICRVIVLEDEVDVSIINKDGNTIDSFIILR